MATRTMYDKIWESHVVREVPGEPTLIYIDRHLIHEGTSPQAFAGVEAAKADRKSTRLNSSHDQISYAVFCLKKKKSNIKFLLACSSHTRTLVPCRGAFTLPTRPIT